jgi:hypothetical protein
MGGVDNTSAAERHIVRRACVLIVELERLEGKFAQAGEASAEDLDATRGSAETCVACSKVSGCSVGRGT